MPSKSKEELAEEYALRNNVSWAKKELDHDVKTFLAGYAAGLESEAVKGLRKALERIAHDYLEEGMQCDCSCCDYDGRINLKHHPECTYVIAKTALQALQSKIGDANTYAERCQAAVAEILKGGGDE